MSAVKWALGYWVYWHQTLYFCCQNSLLLTDALSACKCCSTPMYLYTWFHKHRKLLSSSYITRSTNMSSRILLGFADIHEHHNIQHSHTLIFIHSFHRVHHSLFHWNAQRRLREKKFPAHRHPPWLHAAGGAQAVCGSVEELRWSMQPVLNQTRMTEKRLPAHQKRCQRCWLDL